MKWKGEIEERARPLCMMMFLLFGIPGFIQGQSTNKDDHYSEEIINIEDDYVKIDTLTKDSLAQDYHPGIPRESFIKRPMMLSVKYTGGKVLPTNVSVKGANAISYAQYAEAKLGFSTLGNRWKDVAYGMPYYGIGIGIYDFNRKDFGHPISAYLYQGAVLHKFSQVLQLKYEWNFGVSFN